MDCDEKYMDAGDDEPARELRDRPPTTAEVHAAALQEEETIAARQERHADEDTEADSDAEPHGAGPRGRGDCMHVGSFEKRRALCDGGGLCSLGRWPPWDRPEPAHPRLLAVREIGLKGVRAWCTSTGASVEELFTRLARGEVSQDPWPPQLLSELTNEALSLFDDGDQPSARARPGDREQLVHVRLLQALLRDAADPDVNGMNHFARGVRLGVNVRMPRTPAVYAQKRHWKLPDQYHAHHHYGHDTVGVWRDNYRSVTAHASLIQEQLEEHAQRGLALRMTPADAQRRFPGLSIVSMGAVAKVESPTRAEDLRLVMDGTHGVHLNTHTKPRDQDRCPTAADVKRVQREQGRSRRALGLAVDVKEAHRLPPIHQDDWRHLACRVHPEGPIYIYMYGVFGFAASAYWWSRLGGAALRLLHHLAPRAAELWLLMMADDIKIESTSTSSQLWILWVIVILRLLGIPLSWHKIQGGSEITWIGYSIQLSPLAVGISASRAAWASAWMLRAARDGAIDVGELRSVVGRLAFVAGALEYERPFLSPLFTFLAIHPGRGIRELPTYVRLVLKFLAMRLQERRYYPSVVARTRQSQPFRVDAHAEGDEVGIGGWIPWVSDAGDVVLERSRWFSVRLDRVSAPWAFYRGQPYKAIAALEALAVLVGFMALGAPELPHHDAVALVPGFTDNRGNKYALTHLQTTKFPLVLLLMELSCQLERRSQRLALTWAPREANQEADRLAAGDTTGFHPNLRVEVDVKSTKWIVLDAFMNEGIAFERERQQRAADRQLPPRAQRRRPPFRELQPW